MSMRKFSVLGLGFVLGLLPTLVLGAQLVVMQVRGGPFSVGQQVSPEQVVSLNEGERVTVIGPDGRTRVIRGPHSGPLVTESVERVDNLQALRVLVANRDARLTSVGVVRAGTGAVQTPHAWAIDISRGGPRCLLEGEYPILWRPDTSSQQAFVVYPADRSWRADFIWEEGQQWMQKPELSQFKTTTSLWVNLDQQEFAITFSIIPAVLNDDFMLASWMLERGCIQQADALLRNLSEEFALGDGIRR